MRAAISLLVLLLSMCGVQTESHGTDASTQDVSTELKELSRATLRHTQDEADNVAMKQRPAVSDTRIEALERALHDIKAEMDIQVYNLKLRLFVTETKVENLEKEIRPKVAFSAALQGPGYAVGSDLNLVFKHIFTNVGQAYSSTTGFFTAPVRGVYYFRFTVMDNLDRSYMYIRMHKNGEQLMWLYDYGTDGWPAYLSSGLTLQLEKGDTVNMVLPANTRLYDDINNYSTFSGFLLFPL